MIHGASSDPTAEPLLQGWAGLEERRALARFLEGQGAGELVLLHLYSATVPLALTLDEKHLWIHHAADELAHFEAVASAYEEVAAVDLMSAVEPTLVPLPRPRTWLEAVVAALLIDGAVTSRIAPCSPASPALLRNLRSRILAGESDHQAAAGLALRQACQCSTARCELVSSLVDRWLPIAVGFLKPWLGEPFPSAPATISAYATVLSTALIRSGCTPPSATRIRALAGSECGPRPC